MPSSTTPTPSRPTLTAHIARGAHLNIGTGLPEQVCRILFEAGLHEEVDLLVESGPLGGVPASGLYFGASFSPKAILSSAEMFKLSYERLDATCLGALEVDGEGSVNVSRRSEGPRDYIGPGGFIDLSTAARTIVFVSGWTVHGEIAVEGGRVRIVRVGAPKFVDRVQEITFNGACAIAAGKQVFYATPVGLFRLTRRGMELASIMPGIDVVRDIVEVSPMRLILPALDQLPVVPHTLVSGATHGRECDGVPPRHR
jgi:propionate CoA-transferase